MEIIEPGKHTIYIEKSELNIIKKSMGHYHTYLSMEVEKCYSNDVQETEDCGELEDMMYELEGMCQGMDIPI